MLVQKLLRLDDTLIKEIEEVAKKKSEVEYTSFSALVRKLLRQGLDNMNSNLDFSSVEQQVFCDSKPLFLANVSINNVNTKENVFNGKTNGEGMWKTNLPIGHRYLIMISKGPDYNSSIEELLLTNSVPTVRLAPTSIVKYSLISTDTEKEVPFIEKIKELSSSMSNDINKIVSYIKNYRITEAAKAGGNSIIYNMNDFMDDLHYVLYRNGAFLKDIKYFLKIYNGVIVSLGLEGFIVNFQISITSLDAIIRW